MWRPAAIRAAQATRSLLPRSVQCHGNGGALARPAGHGPCGAVLRVATAPRGCAALSSATGDGDGQGPDERHQETPQEKKARVLKARLMQGGLREPVRAQHEKLFTATEQVLAARDAVPFPPLAVEPLAPLPQTGSGGHLSLADTWGGHVTLLTLSFKAAGRKQLQPYHDAYMQMRVRMGASGEAEKLDRLQLWDVVFYEGVTYRLLKPLMRRGLAGATSGDLLHHTVTHFANYSELFCDDAGVHNRVIGYVYLLDGNGLIRWRAHNTAAEGEPPAMVEALETLLTEAAAWGGE